MHKSIREKANRISENQEEGYQEIRGAGTKGEGRGMRECAWLWCSVCGNAT